MFVLRPQNVVLVDLLLETERLFLNTQSKPFVSSYKSLEIVF